MVDRQDTQQRQLHREGAGLDTVHAEPDHEHLLRTADRVGDGVDVLRRIDQPGFLLSLGLGAPQALGQRRVRMRALGGGGRAVVVTAVAARQRFADRVLQVRIALEAQLLAELDPARLAYAPRLEERRVGKESVRKCRYRWAPS